MSLTQLDDRRRHERSLELASSAIDFDLTSAEAGELEAHFAACPACVRRAAAMRADTSALGRPLALLASRRVDDAVYAEIARRPARSGRLLLVAAAMALLLVALLGAVAGGAYLLRTWQTLPTTVVPSPTVPVAVASPRPDASPAAVGETWGTLAIPTSDVGTGWIGLMEAVAATESGFVAVGGPVCAPQNDPTKCRASIWTAAAGESWTRVSEQPGLDVGITAPVSSPMKGIFDVASGPAGLVAIGFAYDGPGGRPGIWRSPDGRTWERIQVTFGSSPADAFYSRIVAVAASPQGYVIVGYVIDQVGPAVFRARAAAWTSPDGATWARSADTVDMDVGPCVDTGEEPDCGGMRAVVATATGFVAVGQARTAPEFTVQSRPAAWTSPDGVTWTRSDAGLDFGGDETVNVGGLLSGVTVGGPGLVAVGTICQPDCFGAAAGGVAATSVDGSTWTVTPVTGAAALEDVASAGSQVFALGVLNPDADPRGDLQLWRTGDGVAWLRVPGLPSIPDATSYRSLDIAAADDRLVVVGWAEVTGVDVRRNFAYVSPLPGSSAPPDAAPSPTPPPRLVFVDDTRSGKTVTIDIDDQSGLLVEATKGEYFSVDNPGPGLCRWEGIVVGPCGKEVVLLNGASDDSVLRVEWAAGGGCATSYSMTIDPTARKLRIEGPPAGSDSIGGKCDVTLRFAEPVPAEQVDAVLVARG